MLSLLLLSRSEAGFETATAPPPPVDDEERLNRAKVVPSHRIYQQPAYLATYTCASVVPPVSFTTDVSAD